jgi:hypothetical protein
MSRHVSLFVCLAHATWPQDVEPVIRQALVEQIPHIAAYLFQARTASSRAQPHRHRGTRLGRERSSR